MSLDYWYGKSCSRGSRSLARWASATSSSSRLELVRAALLPRPGRARAFIAKPTTRALIERLEVDQDAGCAAGAVPAGFRARRRFRGPFPSLPRAVWRAVCIARTMDGHLVEHIAGATAIEAREKAAPKPKAAKPKRRKRGRPRKGEARAKEPSPGTATDDEPSADAGRPCDVGTKRNAKGHTMDLQAARRYRRWRDPHQLHHDVCVDASQVAIPLG